MTTLGFWHPAQIPPVSLRSRVGMTRRWGAKRIAHVWSITNRTEKEKANLISQTGLYLCRQRPTLPHTFACSTIGPAGLNFRVRDGNGWSPRGKITDKSQLSAIGRQLSATCAAPTFKADAQQTCKRSQPPLPINPRADS